ncbi:hypothetical protein BH747_03115 [Enterococcus villorum]|uniref:Uncharacterized protein n=1 Tax=Enterococcus villorum TaxID=112904 RepID=A0A1V8YFB2_9ENTE|nr:DUF1304 domain-containing protein [Enterococcus villorum]OQO71006.1 hypothetical protein BH747_03115 [Enterococcus villorum]OQO76793.1 hypothetical protein BH744_01665 [Enterococcus villorum]
MSLFSQLIITLVAVEFFYIMYLETFATASKTTGRVFKLNKQELNHPTVQTLFKNQGVYNGLLGVALLYGAYFSSAPKEISALLLIYILLVAAYGSLTSDKMILLKQGGLAFVGLITLLL